MPDELGLGPGESLELAQKLLNAGRPFHAHEVLEGAWKGAPEAERELWKGMAQLAVGLTHVRRGNDKGAVSLLSRAVERISESPEPPYGIDGPGLVAYGRALIERVEREGVGRIRTDELRPQLKVLT
jgi:predicted metal-dependent hydrolase